MSNPVSAYRGIPAQPTTLDPTQTTSSSSGAKAASGLAAPDTPTMTPARAPVCEGPEPVTYTTTSVGSEAAKNMPATWGAGGAPPAPPAPSQGPATGLAKAGEKLDAALEGKACEATTEAIVGNALSYIRYLGPVLGPVAGKVVAKEVCNPAPRNDAANRTGGGAEGDGPAPAGR